MPRLSVVVITLDVADLLPEALESLPPGVEIVVADGGSRDGTSELARSLGARVVPQDLDAIARADGVFDVARNAAAAQATGDWLLYLDADERLSPALAAEIVELVADEPSHDAYEIPRSNLFWGRSVRLLGSDYQVRLARRGCGQFSGKALHEPMRVEGPVGRLQSELVHQNVRGWNDVVRRFRRYVPVEARRLGRRPTLRESLARPFHLFRFYYLKNGAFRDGIRGLAASAVYAIQGAAVLWAARRIPHAEG